MNSTNPIALLGCIAIAIASARVLSRFFPPIYAKGRYAPIDGLRGVLALLVFIHHGAHWYDYLRTGEWINPPSRLYANIGTGSVVFFFLLSGFLFIDKIADRRTEINWRKLYVHRFFRITPLYLFTVAILFVIVALLSDARVDSTTELLKSISTWLTFTIFGQPAINSVPTFDITSGVTWSLTFEWFFYLSLPLLAFSMRRRVSLAVAVLAIVGLLVVGSQLDDGRRFLGFAGAPIAVFAVQSSFVRRWSKGLLATALVIAFVLIATLGFDGPYERVPLMLLSAAFILIACGCDVVGLLTSRWALNLGELAYSIYLLHGVVLFVAFKMIVGRTVMQGLTPTQYWLCVFALTPVVVAVATLTYRWIEKPGIAAGRFIDGWLADRVGRWRAPRPIGLA